MAKTRATPRDSWHDELASVVTPLTKEQKTEIRAVLPRQKAAQLLTLLTGHASRMVSFPDRRR
ncbi:hypothetical protein JYU09_00555 [bacterium AH-315-O15]|nr:hypothetical protein [bacterium AH-315-O15]